ncbi:MAG: hypothetical protein ACOX9R_18585 [Armatimonadota bacterium]|jgi:outer membrane lipoprotein-sorting protein
MIRFGKLAVVQIALIATTVAVVHGQPQPLELLRQSILSRTTVDFSGIRTVVVFQDGKKVRGVEQKIDSKAPDNLRIVVTAPESERGKLCLIAGREQWDYTPSSGRAVRTQVPPASEVMQARLRELETLAGRMKMQYVGRESVAGRAAHVVKVYTDRGLPLKKSWLDVEKHVELKTQRFDSRGEMRSSAYYTRIDYAPTFPPSHFSFSPPDGATVVEADRSTERMTLEQAEQAVGFKAALPEYLPPGYHFCRDQAAVIEVKGNSTLWLSFTNGADTFSLFQREASGSLDPVLRGRSIIWQDGNYRFTLMGTLSADELQKVKASVKP